MPYAIGMAEDGERLHRRVSRAARGRIREIVTLAGDGASSGGITVLLVGDEPANHLAANATAAELGRDLFRIDLMEVASRYIGETEKALDRLFAEAEERGAVLMVEEADDLFARRSEVKDSHDRYANIDAEALVGRLEAHKGVAFLATNPKTNIDHAFVRRLRFIVEFPLPPPL